MDFSARPEPSAKPAGKRWSIRAQLNWLVAVLVVPLVLNFLYEIYQDVDTEFHRTSQMVLRLTRVTAADTERLLRDSERLLATLAQQPAVQALGAQGCDPVFGRFREVQPRYANLLLLDLAGNVICSALPTRGAATARLPRVELLQRVRDERRFIVGQPERGFISGKRVVPLVYPVYDRAGSLAGVIGVSVDLPSLHPLIDLTSAEVPAGTVYAVVNSSGTMIAHSLEPEQAVGRNHADSPLLRAALETRSGTVRTTDQAGVDRLVGVLPVAGADWYAITAVPLVHLRANAWRLILEKSAYTLVVVFGAMFLARHVARRIEGPIQRIAEAVRQVEQQRASVRVPVEGAAELAAVASQFNRTLDVLERERQSLQESRTQLHAILESMGEVAWSTSADQSRLYFVSPVVESIYGRCVEEFMEKPDLWSEAVHPEDRAVAAAFLERVRDRGQAEAEYRILRPDDTQRWLHVRARVIEGADGEWRLHGIISDVTERKQAEHELRRSEERFRAIAESSPVPLLITRLDDGRILYANQNCAELLARPAQALVGTNIADYYEDQADSAALRLRITRSGAYRNHEFRGRCGDGGVAWVVASGRLSTFDGEQAVFMSLYDITERKRVERALQESEERARAIVASIPVPIFIVGKHDARVLFANESCMQAFGISRDEMAQQFATSFYADPATHAMVVEHIKDGGAFGALDLELRRRDGTTFWAAASAQSATFNGVPAVFVGLVDISEQKRMAAALKKSEARLAGIIASAMDGVISVDARQRIVLFNPAAERMFGYPAREVIGQPLDLLLPAGARGVHRHEVDNYAKYGVTSRRMGALGKVAGRRAGGAEFPLEASISRLEVGGEVLLTVILRDITERVRDEQAIRDLTESLERRVAERTEQLARANRELEAFSYSVSHDLRAPLRAINGFAAILLDNERAALSEDGRQLLDRVKYNALRMGQLIDDILRFSHIGRSELVLSEVDMARLAAQVADELREHYPAARVHVGAMPAVQGDQAMLRQVYSNLIGNALKFSSRREAPRVEVGARSEGGAAVFYVGDNGAGFDMAYADKLFGVFQRLHKESEYGGTGVGLAIVKRIVERHGGRVWAESAPGQGAVFYFSLGGGPPGGAAP